MNILGIQKGPFLMRWPAAALGLLMAGMGALFLVSLLGCSPSSTTDMQQVLDKISHSPEADLPSLLYGYGRSSPAAQKILLDMLRPLRAPLPNQHMAVEAVRHSGRFRMIVARVPWPRGNEPAGFHPIIITGESGREQVVGYVLPFNDVITLIQGRDMENVMELAQWWIQDYGKPAGF